MCNARAQLCNSAPIQRHMNATPLHPRLQVLVDSLHRKRAQGKKGRLAQTQSMPDADERAALHSTFIKGVHVRMHIGTVCRFGGYDWCCFNAPRCKVLGFDNEESKWRVQLENVNMELLVPEWSLRLGYCLLPSSLTIVAQFLSALRSFSPAPALWSRDCRAC